MDWHPIRLVTDEEIRSKQSPAGGWTKSDLAEWGVPWPPPKGWRKRLSHAPVEQHETLIHVD